MNKECLACYDFLQLKNAPRCVLHDKAAFYSAENTKRAQSKIGGVKADDGKPRMDLIPMDALVEVAKVLGFGSKKYGDRNWEQGISRQRLRAAQMRHDAATELGQDIDEESGLLHVAHKATDALMELALKLRKLDK